MRNRMTSGGGGSAGGSGGGSMIKKSSSAMDKRKLMEMSGSDRFALMVAQKTMEVKMRIMDERITKMSQADDGSSAKLNGKAKKMIQMMFQNEFKKEFKKTEKKIMVAAKEREQKVKEMLRGSNTGPNPAQAAADYQKQQAATQESLKRFYNTDDLKGPGDSGGNGWW